MNRFDHRFQRAQSLTEFLVLCVALVPLFLLAPMIAKYQDIMFAAHVAGRYVAFDAMYRNGGQGSWKSESDLQQEATRRILANPDAPVKTHDSSGNFDAHRNLFWRDIAGNPLIRDVERDIQVVFGTGFQKSRENNAFKKGADGVPFNIGIPPVGETMQLPAPGVYTAGVQIELANLPNDLALIRPFNEINLRIRSHTSLIIDGWSAKNPGAVNARLDHFQILPAARMAAIFPADLVSFFELGNVPKPAVAKLEIWEDVIPADRRRSPTH
jgi:hypothetical protein